jgi:hypothetical protein
MCALHGRVLEVVTVRALQMTWYQPLVQRFTICSHTQTMLSWL